MKSLSRPYRNTLCTVPLASAAVLILGAVILPGAVAQAGSLRQSVDLPNLLLRSSAPGYMGVLTGDIDGEAAMRLKLHDNHGALVTLIDHDAPAAQSGIRVNDVILEVDGQKVESSEQFSRLLRERPAGRTLTVIISRDGVQQTLKVELADRKKIEHDVWNKLDGNRDGSAAVPAMGMLSGGGAGNIPSGGGGFHMPFFGSTLNVGALVEPLTAQMIDYLGIQSGLMIKQVSRKSQADAAGLKAFDVILKVGGETIATTADWDRTLRANQNKTVQVIVLRDRKQQTLTLQVDSHRRRSSREEQPADAPLVAATTRAVESQQ